MEKTNALLTSGSKIIDSLLGGGLREGRLVAVEGRSNTGKSQLAMQAVTCAAAKGMRSLYVDTEGAFRPERVREMALARKWADKPILERIVYFRCSSAAEQMEVVRSMARRKETADCSLVVYDTLTRNFSLDLPGNENMPSRQGALDVNLSEMARDAFLHRRAYLLANRVTFDKEGVDVGIGGSTVNQLVDTSIRLRRKGTEILISRKGGGDACSVIVGTAGIGVQ